MARADNTGAILGIGLGAAAVALIYVVTREAPAKGATPVKEESLADFYARTTPAETAPTRAVVKRADKSDTDKPASPLFGRPTANGVVHIGRVAPREVY